MRDAALPDSLIPFGYAQALSLMLMPFPLALGVPSFQDTEPGNERQLEFYFC
jgi:hypothetical protein